MSLSDLWNHFSEPRACCGFACTHGKRHWLETKARHCPGSGVNVNGIKLFP